MPAPLVVTGKAEVYECHYDGFLIRYSRWIEGYDRYGYFDRENGVPAAEWYIGDEFAGRQWTSVEVNAREKQPYQWSATYRYQPFSISVEGVTAEKRAEGLAMVRATLPSRVRLR